MTLDLGSRCGWAIGKVGEVVLGAWDIAPRHGESPGMRYIRLRSCLQEMEPVSQEGPQAFQHVNDIEPRLAWGNRIFLSINEDPFSCPD